MILREWREEDLKPFARMNGDPMIMEYMPRHLDEASSNKHVARIQKHFKKYGYGLFALENKEDGAFMGFTGLNNVDFRAHFTPAVEIAWRLDYGYWGKGFGTEAAQGVLDYGFDQIGLGEIVSFTVFDNTRSIGVMENIGMNRVEGGEFLLPTLPKDHPLGSFVLYNKLKP